MTQPYGNTGENILVAVDIAKKQDAVLIQFPDGSRKKFTVANNLNGYRNLSDYLNKLKLPCKIGLEATGNYHRTPAYYLQQRGFDLKLISSVAASRTREAMFNCIFWPNLAGDSGSNWPLILVQFGRFFRETRICKKRSGAG